MVSELGFNLKKAEDVHDRRPDLMRILALYVGYGSYFE